MRDNNYAFLTPASHPRPELLGAFLETKFTPHTLSKNDILFHKIAHRHQKFARRSQTR